MYILSDIRSRIRDALGGGEGNDKKERLNYEETLRRRGPDDPEGFNHVRKLTEGTTIFGGKGKKQVDIEKALNGEREERD